MRISPLAGRVLASNLRQPRDRRRSRTVSFWPDVRDISDVRKWHTFPVRGVAQVRQLSGVHLPYARCRQTGESEEKSILAHPQFRWRSRNSRILRVASVAPSSLYSNQRPHRCVSRGHLRDPRYRRWQVETRPSRARSKLRCPEVCSLSNAGGLRSHQGASSMRRQGWRTSRVALAIVK
jgi:hypothetical protein